MLLEPSLLSMVTAKIKGGKFSNLQHVHIKGAGLLFLSAIIQILLSLARNFTGGQPQLLLEKFSPYAILLSYLLIVMALWINRRKNYMKVFLIGVLLNLLVIAANGGQMPVALDGLSSIRQESELPERAFDIKHTGVHENTRFVYLADIILLDRPYPLPKILSLGDIFIMTGVFMFFLKEMKSPEDQ